MDNNEAKLVLSGYTLSEDPKGNARFDEALKQTKLDPELAEWWEGQRARDRQIADQFRSIEVPTDLKAALNESLDGKRQKLIRFAKFRNFLAIAATLAIAGFLGLKYGIDRSDDYVGPLASRAYEYSVDGPRLTYFNKDTQKIKDWLLENGMDIPEQLPPLLLEQEGIGCRPLKWSEQNVALMCFNAETVYHLFIGNESEFPAFAASGDIGYEYHEDGWSVSKWETDEHVFVLTAKTTPANMSNILASYTP